MERRWPHTLHLFSHTLHRIYPGFGSHLGQIPDSSRYPFGSPSAGSVVPCMFCDALLCPGRISRASRSLAMERHMQCPPPPERFRSDVCSAIEREVLARSVDLQTTTRMCPRAIRKTRICERFDHGPRPRKQKTPESPGFEPVHKNVHKNDESLTHTHTHHQCFWLGLKVKSKGFRRQEKTTPRATNGLCVAPPCTNQDMQHAYDALCKYQTVVPKTRFFAANHLSACTDRIISLLALMRNL